MAGPVRLLVLDIDGVLTDGRVYIDEHGAETKCLFYRDLDALAELRRRGVELALLTGEDAPIVAQLVRRLGIQHVKVGQKDKLAGIREVSAHFDIPLEEMAYMGDACRDIPALQVVGRAFCPADAHRDVLAGGFVAVSKAGGAGAVEEAVGLLLAERIHS